MSAFLGPIHHGMYRKIQAQDALTTQLLDLFGSNELAKQLEQAYGLPDTQKLEEIIDQSNIHGWLSACVQRAEARFAVAVKALLQRNGGDLAPLKEAARSFGRQHAIPRDAGIAQAYQAIDCILLDGMPCDGGRQVLSEDGDELVFHCDSSLHTLCQSEAGAAAFFALREARLAGMLEGSALEATTLGGGTFRLMKGG